ncbi:hypothetical protein [Fructobacillus tropaeoli]|uniref:hypothetical protein n=1 Tax=Fructobacillus tropaeoli TaxID=709323 RepID=UPI001944A78F|nr:hypothetical protein [Fructobacillus tropaeoli]GIC69787.1 hypothetical protein FT12353_04250 [Fructobacillus tropaeoli]
MEREDHIVLTNFSKIDVNDSFFQSLRASYSEFDEWFRRKAALDEKAYVSYDVNHNLIAFVYLKKEHEIDDDVVPSLTGKRLKIGTFKVDFKHHSALGKRLLAIVMRKFAELSNEYKYLYVTLYANDNTMGLQRLLQKYGFSKYGVKNGKELVFRKMVPDPNGKNDVYQLFPFFSQNEGNDYLLAILPKYHNKMFGEVDLKSERHSLVEDTSSINSIEKIYLSASINAMKLIEGDHVVAYRMNDNMGPAYYRSVITSVGTITEVKSIRDFSSYDVFYRFVKGKSIFTDEELNDFWHTKKYPWIIKFIYNFSFATYPNRKLLLEKGVINQEQRIVIEPIQKTKFKEILEMGDTNENFVID